MHFLWEWIWLAIDTPEAAIGAFAVGCLHLLNGAWRSFEFWSAIEPADPRRSLMLLINQPAMYVGWLYLLAVPGLNHLSRFSCGSAVFPTPGLQYVPTLPMGLWSFGLYVYAIPLLLAGGRFGRRWKYVSELRLRMPVRQCFGPFVEINGHTGRRGQRSGRFLSSLCSA